MSAALPASPTRSAVAITPINTGIFSGVVSVLGGGIVSFRVEVDGATGTFYTGSGFTPVGAEATSQYVQTMGFLLSILGFTTAGLEGQEIRIEQARSGAATWKLVRTDVLIGGVPYIQRGIPIVGSLARVSIVNNAGGAIDAELEIKALTL